MNIDLKNSIGISHTEVLRYLQYKGQFIDKNLTNLIDECIGLTANRIDPRYILRVYSIQRNIYTNEIGEKIHIVNINGTNLKLESKNIYDLLQDCSECIIIAATLGINIDKEIRKYSYSNLTKGIIIDSCATTVIEEMCDVIQNSIKKDLELQGKYVTNRYSPGYGDLSIEVNAYIINILGAQNKIGLTISKNMIMIPRKSVVAIMGISNIEKENKKSCLNCTNYNNCQYKRKVGDCGH